MRKAKNTNTQVAAAGQKKGFIAEIRRNWGLYLLILPCIIYAIVFKYLPMVGIVIAFEDFNPIKGMFGSKLIGFGNFKYFFRGSKWMQITFNTLWLNTLFIITGTIASIAIAIMLTELGKGLFVRFNQSAMILPNFISYAVVAMFLQAFIGSEGGLINRFLTAIGKDTISFYSNPDVWPLIFVIIRIWKGAGYGAIVYMATIVGIDTEIYESARIDGASRWQIIMKITLPLLKNTVILLTLMSIGNIFYGDFGMIYTIIGDNSMLFPTTDVIDTYVFRSIRTSGSMGMSAAVGLYQSVIGFILVVTVNKIAKKLNPESAIF